jgi:phosphatidylserine/phosphatidylglycerophosphate/cardiolipin synthase-like enzyme
MPAQLGRYFSPHGGCQLAICKELIGAKSEVLVQAYSFTADPITYGLVDAHRRGVNVQILLDRSNELEAWSDLQILLNNGLAPLIDDKHAIAHNKVMIIDRTVLITGSYNFTTQAENSNAENMLIIRGDADTIEAYWQNWQTHHAHSRPPQKPAAAAVAKRAA